MLSRWLFREKMYMTGSSCPMVMRASYWKLFLKYIISDQTNINCILIIPCQEILLIPGIMKMQEKQVTEFFTPDVNEIYFSSFYYGLHFCRQDPVTSHLLCVMINVMLLFGGFGISYALLCNTA